MGVSLVMHATFVRVLLCLNIKKIEVDWNFRMNSRIVTLFVMSSF